MFVKSNARDYITFNTLVKNEYCQRFGFVGNRYPAMTFMLIFQFEVLDGNLPKLKAFLKIVCFVNI